MLSFYSKAISPRINFKSIAAFSTLQEQDLKYFRSILEPHEIVTEPSELEKFNTDWMKKYVGYSKLALKPNTSQKVSSILKYCNSKNLKIVPQGGNTGLVGGSVPLKDEIVLSLTNMNKILGFSENLGVVSVEAGCVLDSINQFLLKYGSEVPLDLGAKGSCCIGGNIATNAGGIRFVKFGPFRASILGLEVVLPSGEILNLESEIRKDNTGFDLKQLFIGSEGTLGVITKANILTSKLDKFRQVLFMRADSFEKVLKIHNLIKQYAGKNLAALEYLDEHAYYTVAEQLPKLHKPFAATSDKNKFYVLTELAGSERLEPIVESLYQALDENKLIEDCVLSENEAQLKDLWEIRENVSLAATQKGLVFKYDVSLSIEKFNEIIEKVRQRAGSLGDTLGYGHIGDGNLHINVICFDKKQKKQMEEILEPYVLEEISAIKGSISAEHGLGSQKAKFIHLAKDKNTIELMRQVKKIFDPNNILNPGKVIPE